MTIYKVVPMRVESDERWGVEWVTADGRKGIIGPFATQAKAHAEAERMSALEGERGA
jgi:hypothetical protein